MAKTAKKTAPTKTLEQTLWEAADKMRGNLEAGEYKHIVLGLVFLEYVSDAFEERHNSTSESWLRLISRRNQLAGRVRRLTIRSSGQYDEDGNPIPLRRHHPEAPRRSRLPRFIRQ